MVPIGFDWNGEQVILWMPTTSLTVRAMNSNGHVALSIDIESARALIVRRVATLETVDGVPDEYVQASKKVVDDVAVAFGTSWAWHGCYRRGQGGHAVHSLLSAGGTPVVQERQ